MQEDLSLRVSASKRMQPRHGLNVNMQRTDAAELNRRTDIHPHSQKNETLISHNEKIELKVLSLCTFRFHRGIGRGWRS